LSAALAQMGVANAPASLRASRENTFVPAYSSIDKTPVRRNAVLPTIKK